MSWIDEPLTVRRFVWLVGWVIVALMVITLLLVLFNTPANTEGRETGLSGTSFVALQH